MSTVPLYTNAFRELLLFTLPIVKRGSFISVNIYLYLEAAGTNSVEYLYVLSIVVSIITSEFLF